MADPAGQTRLNVIPGQLAARICHPQRFHASTERADVVLADHPVCRPDPEANEACAGTHRCDGKPLFVNPQPKLFEIVSNRVNRFGKLTAVVGEQDEVIAIPHVGPDAKMAGDEVILTRQIPIGEPLAGQVSDGQSSSASMRLEQVVAGEVLHHRLLLVAAIHDQVHEPKDLPILDQSPEQGLENLVVDAWEVLANVALDEVAVAAHQRLEPIGGGVYALVLATGEAGRVHVPVEDRLQHVHQGVVDDSVTVRCSRDKPGLGASDPVRGEVSGTIGAFAQLLAQGQ